MQRAYASLCSPGVAPKITDQDWQRLTDQEEAETRTQIPGGRASIGSAFGGQLTLAVEAVVASGTSRSTVLHLCSWM